MTDWGLIAAKFRTLTGFGTRNQSDFVSVTPARNSVVPHHLMMEKAMLNKFVLAAAVATVLAAPATAQERVTTGVGTPGTVQTLNTLPPNIGTVSNWYKQDVYDPNNNKIGQISDVLVNKDGKVEGFIVSVGGFLGIGEKDVAVPFNTVHETEKNGKPYLTMNATKDMLKNAVGFKYDKNTATWVHA